MRRKHEESFLPSLREGMGLLFSKGRIMEITSFLVSRQSWEKELGKKKKSTAYVKIYILN